MAYHNKLCKYLVGSEIATRKLITVLSKMNAPEGNVSTVFSDALKIAKKRKETGEGDYIQTSDLIQSNFFRTMDFTNHLAPFSKIKLRLYWSGKFGRYSDLFYKIETRDVEKELKLYPELNEFRKSYLYLRSNTKALSGIPAGDLF